MFLIYSSVIISVKSKLSTAQGFVTDNEKALEVLFGDDEGSRSGDACLNEIATRIATVFASLRVII